MKFKVSYRVGKDIREKHIMAKDLEDAVKVAEKKEIRWIDIIQLNNKESKDYGDNEDV